MRNLLNPKWLLVINTLPLALLFFLSFSNYSIISSLLEEQSISLWITYGLALFIICLLNIIYVFYATVSKNKVSIYYGFTSLIVHITFIYSYYYHINEIIPFGIPNWMISENASIYVGTFLMPTLAYSLFVLVIHFTPNTKKHKAWVSFIIALAVPTVWYLSLQTILPLWKMVEDDFGIHVILILIISGTLIFLFFLIRSALILISKKGSKWKQYNLVWKIPISILLPIIGLELNNGNLTHSVGSTIPGLFGDFNSIWFYLLSLLNGILICLPQLKNKYYTLLLFLGRSFTFSFTLYFFIVFLPFLPLSLVAIVAFGTGFLMLAPMLIFIVQVQELSKNYQILKRYFNTRIILVSSITAFLLIPFGITITYLNDRFTLIETLDYIYNPDYSKIYKIDKVSLKHTLSVLKSHKDRNNRGVFGSCQPYLSSYYNWLVLDNLTLSEKKINTIERIFFDEKSLFQGLENVRNKDVHITNISTESSFDKKQNIWKSWVNLEITNGNERSLASEYVSNFNLPEGAWISDYYLHIGDKKEMGILAEKKSAMWVFSNIRNENRDPGILYYLTGNKIAFRVFPFSKGEVRKTGIELIHKEPIEFTLDGNKIKLGQSRNNTEIKYEDNNMIYVTAEQKLNLKEVKRRPYFHFIVDATDKDSISEFVSRINNAIKDHRALAENAKISFVNSYVSTHSLDTNWSQKLEEQSFEGGLYVDRAIKSILFDSYTAHTASYPVIVLITDSLEGSIFDKDFANWEFAFPENNKFYNLRKGGVFEAHSLLSNVMRPIQSETSISFNQSVLEYKINESLVTYLPNDHRASIVLKSDRLNTEILDIKEKNWKSALTMHGLWMSQILHPENSNEEWLKLVKYSFVSKVMTPVTSYLVVENAAQKAILKKKQDQVLSGNKSLDLDEDTQRMSEPSLLVLLTFFVLIVLFKNRIKIMNAFQPYK